jgi:broad specificity phosphatase PhoE
MTTVYLARHGSTAWNESPRFRGLADVPLSEKGFAQARALAAMLASTPLVAVYSSPLRRAMQTAEEIAKVCGLDVQIRAGLRSVDYGAWEGKTEKEAAESDPSLFDRFLHSIETVTFPGGESMEALRSRAVDALAKIAAAHPDGHVMVVTHQVVTRVLLCAVLGVGSAPYWRLGQDSGCLNVVESRPSGYRLKLMNVVPPISGENGA